MGPAGAEGPAGVLYTPDGGEATIIAGSVTTADTDSLRLRRGATACTESDCKVVEGPFVLTDAVALQPWSQFIMLYTRPAGGVCGSCIVASAGIVPEGSSPLSFILVGGGANNPLAIHGGRFLIARGEQLCAAVHSTSCPSETVPLVSWAGFVPYQ